MPLYAKGEIKLNIEEKQARLKELSRPDAILSDQDYEEAKQLEEELEMIHQEETQSFKETNIDLGNGKGFTVPIKKRKRSLLEIILEKVKKKPITFEQIEKLKNERTVAYLKRDIAVANYERKNPGGKRKQSKSPKSNSIEKEFGPSSKAKDFRDMIGKNDKNKYKDLTG